MYNKLKIINLLVDDYLEENQLNFKSITFNDYMKIINNKKIYNCLENIFSNIKRIKETDISFCNEVVKNIIKIYFENTGRIIEERIMNETEYVVSSGLTAYIKEIEKYPSLSSDEQLELIKDYKENNNISSRDKLIYSNQKIILKYILKKTKDEHLILDMLQEGNIGLMKGIDNFDFSYNCKLSTYIYMWIKSYIDNKFYKKDLIRKPKDVVLEKYKILNYIEELKINENRTPSSEELCKKFHVSLMRLQDILSDNSPSSLNIYVGEDSDDELMDFIPDNNSFFYEIDNEYLIKKALEEMEKILIPSMYEVVVLKLGLIDDIQKTYEEIAKIKGISRQAVEVKYNKALRILSKSPEIRKIFNKPIEKVRKI